MPGLNLIPNNFDLKIISKQRVFFASSALLTVLSLVIFLINGLNYGIDFKGGILIEVRQEKPQELGAIREVLSNLDLGEIALQEFG